MQIWSDQSHITFFGTKGSPLWVPSLRVGVAEAGGVAVTSMQLLSATEQVLVFWLVGVARTPQVSGTPSSEFWSQL